MPVDIKFLSAIIRLLEKTYTYARQGIMAKSNVMLIKLLSTAGTGFYYTKKKNPRTKPEKFRFWKYDPIAGEHVEFEEAKLK